MPYPNELAPLTVIPGAMRFNTDSMKLEYYRGGPVGFGTTTTTGEWVNLTTDSPDIQTGGARGVFGGGYTAPATSFNVIQYITISSTGNAIDFGDLSAAKGAISACSSSTRGVFSGGTVVSAPYPKTNVIEYITISSTGNAQDFGDLIAANGYISACSSSTRGVFGGGSPSPNNTNIIQFITISTLGNATDFGDLTQARNGLAACSSSTRGVFGGGQTPTFINVIEYITIASTGNAQDFGDLSVGKSGLGACSSSTRGVFGGGILVDSPRTYTNVIEYITILTQGNVIDFGDLSAAKQSLSALSNGHGGL